MLGAEAFAHNVEAKAQSTAVMKNLRLEFIVKIDYFLITRI
jgi:hypothetical protein